MEPLRTPKFNFNRKNVATATRIIVLVFAFSLYILADYVHSKIVGELITNKAYWILLFINMVLVISIMLTLRSSRRDKRIATDNDIIDMYGQIIKGYKLVTKKGLMDKLSNYVDELNNDSKYETYLRNIKNKINRLLKKTDFVLMFTPKKKQEKVKKEFDNELAILNEKLKTPKEEVLKMSFRYTTVSISKLFTAIDGRVHNDDKYDIDTHERRDIGNMVGYKALGIILFSAFGGTIIVDFFFGGLGAIYSTLLKIVSLFFAINVSLATADDFVDHNVKTSLQRRMMMLGGFVKEQPELKEDNEKNLA